MSRLREISAKGEPAHQEHARRLIAMMATDPAATSTQHEAELLIDAYLNDPYLTR
jgi:hypothetical protein